MATLHVGDRIYLSEGEGEGALLGVAGPGSEQMGACEGAAPSARFASECVFEVRQQHNYAAAKQIRALVESVGRSALELAADPAHRRLFEDREREREANAAAFERTAGREVRYGQVIQLRNAYSGALLAVTRRSAHVSKDARRVTLEAEPGEAAWLRITPRLRIHAEGQRVQLGDPLLLEHVSTGLRLRVERLGRLSDGRRELCAAGDPTSLKIERYRQHVPAVAGVALPLFGGSVVRLSHKEAEGYLGCEMSAALLGLSPTVVPEEAHVAASCATMWELHKEDVRDGSPCAWAGAVRLVHTPSRRALAVSEEPFAPSSHPGDDGAVANGWRALAVVLEALEEPPLIDGVDASLWELVPQYRQREQTVRMDAFFRLRHRATGRWLHHVPPVAGIADAVFGSGDNDEAEESIASPRRSAAAPPQSPSVESLAPLDSPGAASSGNLKRRARQSTKGDESPLEALARDEMAVSGTGAGASGCGEQGVLTATLGSNYEDVFALQLVDATHSDDVARVIAWRMPLVSFVGELQRVPPPPREKVDFAPLLAALTNLIVFATRSDNPNPLTREGLPHAHRQLLLRELGVLGLALLAAGALLRPPFSAEQLSSAATNRSPLGRAGKLCMILARHALRDHAANKHHGLRFVPQLQSMLGLGIRAAGALTEVFLDNEAQLLRVEDSHVLKFVELLRSTGREAKFLSFLTVLCQCRGVAIRRNQWRVARLLLQGAPELLPSLSPPPSSGGPVLVSGNGHYFPGLTSGPMELSAWLAAEGEEAAAYLEKSLELFAALAEGRNLRNAPLLRERLPCACLSPRQVAIQPYHQHTPRAVGTSSCSRSSPTRSCSDGISASAAKPSPLCARSTSMLSHTR